MYPIENYQFKVYEKENVDNTKSSVVVALSTYCGKVVKGVAKCMQDDAFSLELGKKLAAARCDFKVCKKRKNRANKKKLDAAKELSKATEHYIKMLEYCDDAEAALKASSERLSLMEKSLA